LLFGGKMPPRNGAGKSAGGDVPRGKLLGMKSLLGNKLYDAEGNPVGKLEEIVLDVRTGCVRHVVVTMGGVLGIWRRRFAVPWSALTPDADCRRCRIDVAQMRLTAVPVPDGDLWLQRIGATRAVATGD